MKKNVVSRYIIVIIIVCIFIIKIFITDSNNDKQYYQTVFNEINNLLNKLPHKFDSIDSVTIPKQFDLLLNDKKYKLTLENNLLKQDLQQNLYKSEGNLFCILIVNHNVNMDELVNKDNVNYNVKEEYFLDDFNNPVYLHNADINGKIITKDTIVFCNNLFSNVSRNYLYFDLNKEDTVVPHYTRANEIFLVRNNKLYYIGTDINFSYSDLEEISSIIDLFK